MLGSSSQVAVPLPDLSAAMPVCGFSDPVDRDTRGDAASKSHRDQHLRSEILAAVPIHIILNDMVRCAKV